MLAIIKHKRVQNLPNKSLDSTACPTPAAWHPPGHPTANPTPKTNPSGWKDEKSHCFTHVFELMSISIANLFIYACLCSSFFKPFSTLHPTSAVSAVQLQQKTAPPIKQLSPNMQRASKSLQEQWPENPSKQSLLEFFAITHKQIVVCEPLLSPTTCGGVNSRQYGGPICWRTTLCFRINKS